MARWLICLLLLMTGAAGVHAQPLTAERMVDVGLHSPRAAIAPGERFTVVLRETMREGWHTYWINPGDSGEPTSLTWRLPEGFQAGEIQWPAPEAIPFAMLVNYGYSHEVLLPIEITAPADARVGSTVTLSADAYWLACADVCVPEEGAVNLTLPIEARGRDNPEWAARIGEAVAALPRRGDGVEAAVTAGARVRLSVSIPNLGEVRNARFFPFERDVMEASAPQAPRTGAAGLSFSLSPSVREDLGQTSLGGVVVFEARGSGGWARRALEIEAQPGAPIPDTDAAPAAFSSDYPLAALETGAPVSSDAIGGAGVLLALALAFLGGIVLNVMPCVLPVLTVKALAFARGAQAGEARRHGVLYFAGVMATFLALAGALLSLRAAGEAVGLGFQLQTPWVTSALALLFFAIGLNLLGVFDLGGRVQSTGAELAGRGGDAGAFFTGALAVVAATPCTAPFMAGAVGAALTQSTATALMVFAALGLGFALPMTALHFAPGLQRLIPKPGPWMERARNVLAFPMFGAAIWLTWVFAEQAGAGGMLALLSLAAAVGFALFVSRWGRAWAVAGLIAVAAVAAFAWRPLAGAEARAALVAEPWSAARVEALRAEGRAVFVNFTAAWCVTCKVNEVLVFSRPAVTQAFAGTNTAYLVADWTNRNAEIAAVLDAYQWPGVPLYLYFPADPTAPAQVVPLEGFGERTVLDVVQQGGLE
jgi:thiol:disulfide interchange protein DsbD